MRERPDLEIVRSVPELRHRVAEWRNAGEVVGRAPTVGALHPGHLSLVERARAYATIACASIFVNPTQFGPNEDYEVYPRDESGDIDKLAAAGAQLVFIPHVQEMYPPGAVTQVAVPGIGDILEGEFRPGFFTGVATVVAKLLIQVMPDIAIFGEKDYQQLQVIKRMVADLHLPVRIEGSRTQREADGLAMSSRNVYLSADERRIAPMLFQTITAVANDVAAGADAGVRASHATTQLCDAGFGRVDYVTVRDAASLEPWPGATSPGRVLAAAWLGRTRLIDNVAAPSS
jgi:pantoate--beta-alanine ligase